MGNSNNQRPEQNHDDYKRDIRFDKIPEPSKLPYPGKRPSRLVLFLLMWAPGLGHMYMGLIRRGLFFFSALPLLIYLSVVLRNSFLPVPGVLAGFAIAALYAVSFFESLSLRRDIIEGKEVADRIPNLRGLLQNKLLVGGLAAVVVISILHAVLSALPWPAFLAIGIAIFFIISNRKKRGKNSDDDNVQ